MLLEHLTPDLQLDSVLDIQPEMLGGLGIGGLLLDLDCTLKDYYETSFRQEVLVWIEQMNRAQVRLCILTNGRAGRVQPLAERLGVMCVPWAAKPLTKGIRAGLTKLE